MFLSTATGGICNHNGTLGALYMSYLKHDHTFELVHITYRYFVDRHYIPKDIVHASSTMNHGLPGFFHCYNIMFGSSIRVRLLFSLSVAFVWLIVSIYSLFI